MIAALLAGGFWTLALFLLCLVANVRVEWYWLPMWFLASAVGWHISDVICQRRGWKS